jgi:hypothetical protein
VRLLLLLLLQLHCAGLPAAAMSALVQVVQRAQREDLDVVVRYQVAFLQVRLVPGGRAVALVEPACMRVCVCVCWYARCG